MAPTNKAKTKSITVVQRKSRRNTSNKRGAANNKDKENAENDATTTTSSITINASTSNDKNSIDDQHEQNWWKLHVEKAASLVERCTKQYNWDKADTTNILTSYRHFLLLKKEMKDWEATKLVPCWPVAEMWYQHSQMEDYDYDMRNLLGHVVNRTSSVVLGDEERRMLGVATRNALKSRFGSSYDEELWETIQVCIVDQLGEEEIIEVNKREPLLPRFDQYARDKENCEGGSNCMCIENFQFVFDGKSIDLGKGKRSKSSNEEEIVLEATPLSLGIMKDNARIEAIHVDKVGVTIRSEGKERGYLVEKTSMISKTFDLFVEDIMETEANGKGGGDGGGDDGDQAPAGLPWAAAGTGTNANANANANPSNNAQRSEDSHIGGNASPPATKRSNFVFLLQNENEKRVFGYESPILLGLKSRGNIIDAVPVVGYKCKNCICCFPPKHVEKDLSNGTAMEEEGSDDDASIDY